MRYKIAFSQLHLLIGNQNEHVACIRDTSRSISSQAFSIKFLICHVVHQSNAQTHLNFHHQQLTGNFNKNVFFFFFDETGLGTDVQEITTNIVLLGDHKQLGAVVSSDVASRLGLGEICELKI